MREEKSKKAKKEKQNVIFLLFLPVFFLALLLFLSFSFSRYSMFMSYNNTPFPYLDDDETASNLVLVLFFPSTVLFGNLFLRWCPDWWRESLLGEAVKKHGHGFASGGLALS